MIDAGNRKRLPDHIAGDNCGTAAEAQATERAVDVIDPQLTRECDAGCEAGRKNKRTSHVERIDLDS